MFPSLLHWVSMTSLSSLCAAAAAAALPQQTFESLVSGRPPGAPWQASGGSLLVTDLAAATGEHSLQLQPTAGTLTSEATIPVILGAATPGFVDLRIKPVARTLDRHPDGHAAAGQPSESTGVLSLDGAQLLFSRQANRYSVLALTRSAGGAAQWLRLGGLAGAPSEFEIEDTGGRAKDWLRITVRRDLGAGTWDVWLNERLVGVDLALQRVTGSPEFHLRHRPSSEPTDGALAAVLLDDLQAGPDHPLYADRDRDAMPDLWEAAHERHLDAAQSLSVDVNTPDRGADLDLDQVPKISEYFFGTRPTQTDSDADGIPDGVEIRHGLNPASRLDAALDKDSDGFSNLAEFRGEGNGDISRPPEGALSNVVYVKADHEGVQNGQYATPYRSLGAALGSPYLAAGGRVVVRGEGGALTHFASDWVTPAGNSGLTLSRPVTLVGVNGAVVHLQETAAFATVNILTASLGPVFTCENLAFEGCFGDDGGAFRVVSTPGEVVFRNCRFSGCWAGDDGGAVYAYAARLRFEDCWFENSWAGGEGGALHVEGGSQIVAKRTYFQSNDATTDGGAVSARGATAVPLIFESCVFADNRAARGGALAAVDGADASVVQCTLASNVASLAGGGGALFGGSTASVFSVSGSLFWLNSAQGTAHVHLAGGTSTVIYSTLSGWTSTTGPAGTGNNGSDPLFRAGTLVPSAAAMQDSSNPTANTLPDFLKNPRWDAPGGVTGCLADRGAFERQPDSDGDGLSDDWEVRYALSPADPADADGDADQDGYSNREEFTDKTHPRQASSCKAPAVFVHASSGRDWHPGPNAPTGTVAASLQGTRAYPFRSIRRAILACPVNRRIVLLDGTFSGPANANLKLSESWSWVPHLSSTSLTSTLSLDGKTIRGLNGPGRVTLDGGGSARLLDLALGSGSVSARVTLQNVSLRRGVADLGGAIRVTGVPGFGLLALEGCVLSANRATSAGGAIHATGASLNAQKCTFAGNDAPQGGAVSLVDLSPLGVSSVSTASFSDCRFAYNLATAVNGSLGQGGALSARASSFTTARTRFDFNHAEHHGGALALLSSGGYYPPSFGSGTTFASNSAARRGGGLYSENSCFLTTGCAFTDNQAGSASTPGEGGAIFVAHPSRATTSVLNYSSRTPQLASIRFVNNTANQRGGAVAVCDASPTFTNCAFVENRTDRRSGRGGAVSVFWETAQTTSPLAPAHPSAPRFIHCTLSRNQGALASTLHAEPLTVPWIINSLIGEAGLAPSNRALSGPRQLHGCELNPADGPLSPAESEPARRNQFGTPSLAFDLIHLASPVRAPGDTSSTTGGVEPSWSVTFTRPTTDLDGESRPAAASGKFTLMRGCDEPRDADTDSLPDWFELLAAAFSPLDAVTTVNHTHPVNQSVPTLPTATPTNNADADAYTLTQELLNFGQPDAAESESVGRDSDGDGLSDLFERLTNGLDWTNPDVNGDGVLDGWAFRYYRSATFDYFGDDDQDGLINGLEGVFQTNPRSGDSDGDGIPDAWEQVGQTNPLQADSDGDGQRDTWATLPLDSTGTTAPGLHQPSAAEPWYVEIGWSYLSYSPGSYFYPTDSNLQLWGIDTLNAQSDFVMETEQPFPINGPIRTEDYCRTLTNILGPHEPYLAVSQFAHNLNRVSEIHSNHHTPRFVPLTHAFEGLPATLTALASQPRDEAWAATWYDEVARAHQDGHGTGTVGRARQQWLAHSRDTNLQHSITRLVPSFRLRCTLPKGAPGDVSLSFIRFRGHAARQFFRSEDLGHAHTSHPLEENNFSLEPVVLRLSKGQTTGPVVTLNPQQETPLSIHSPSIPTGTSLTQFFDLIQFDALLPYDIIAHQRGTLAKPGARVPLGFGAYGQETTILQNGDSESVTGQTDPDYSIEGDISEYRRNNDDDVSKLVVRWPVGLDPNLARLTISTHGISIDATRNDTFPVVRESGQSWLRFYTEEGQRITNPPGQPFELITTSSNMISDLREHGKSVFFVDGNEMFGVLDPYLQPRAGQYGTQVRRQAELMANIRGGALIRLGIDIKNATSVQNVTVNKGGLWRFVIPRTPIPLPVHGAIGRLEFRDGKGKINATETDLGAVLGTFIVRSGTTGGAAWNQAEGGGHTPPGWYYIYRRTDLSDSQIDDIDQKNGNYIVRQGPYVRWMQDDAQNSEARYTTNYVYNRHNTRDRNIGLPTTVAFKWQIEPIPPDTASGRTHLQIHPDGRKNGTMGCIGIQSYSDCLAVHSLLRKYHQAHLLVSIE